MNTIEKIASNLNELVNKPSLKDIKGALELPNIITPDEKIIAAITGVMVSRGILIATNKKMIFVGTKLPLGTVRIEEVAYSDTTSLQCQTGMIAAKVIACTTNDKFIMDIVDKKYGRDFVEKIHPMIGKEITTSSVTSHQVSPNGMEEKIGQLERLAKLKEQGILTDEELSKQKSIILG